MYSLTIIHWGQSCISWSALMFVVHVSECTWVPVAGNHHWNSGAEIFPSFGPGVGCLQLGESYVGSGLWFHLNVSRGLGLLRPWPGWKARCLACGSCVRSAAGLRGLRGEVWPAGLRVLSTWCWALRAQPGDRGGRCKGFSKVGCPRVVFCSAVSVKSLCEAQRCGESGFDSISFGTATSHVTCRTVLSMGGIVPFWKLHSALIRASTHVTPTLHMSVQSLL